ncbi:hypothetical protein KTQ42_20960 [Noviherbaspirillum sp. L7-7A]|nr:hypothetical protein [Noviherbaspirillum sp. L7-7A]
MPSLGNVTRKAPQQHVIGENKTGATGDLASKAVAKALGDRSTWLVTPSPVLMLVPYAVFRTHYDLLCDMVQVARLALFNYGFAIDTGSNFMTLIQDIGPLKVNEELGGSGTPECI